jgi:hypothetical protein
MKVDRSSRRVDVLVMCSISVVLVALMALVAAIVGGTDEIVAVALGLAAILFGPVMIGVILQNRDSLGGRWATADFRIPGRFNESEFLNEIPRLWPNRVRSTRRTSNGFRIRTKMMGASLGETIVVSFRRSDRETVVHIRSRSLVPSNVLNSDINASNVHAVRALLDASDETE